jgi:hypothetical protein
MSACRARAPSPALPSRNRRGGPQQATTTSRGAWVVELTGQCQPRPVAERTTLIWRRERGHPGAQLTFRPHGHRLQCLTSDQSKPDIAALQAAHCQYAQVEERVKPINATASPTSVRGFDADATWLELAPIAHEIMLSCNCPPLDGKRQLCEPNRLRCRIPHVAGRLRRHATRSPRTSRRVGLEAVRSPGRSTLPSPSPDTADRSVPPIRPPPQLGAAGRRQHRPSERRNPPRDPTRGHRPRSSRSGRATTRATRSHGVTKRRRDPRSVDRETAGADEAAVRQLSMRAIDPTRPSIGSRIARSLSSRLPVDRASERAAIVEIPAPAGAPAANERARRAARAQRTRVCAQLALVA